MSQKGKTRVGIGFVNSMLLAGRMNPLGFLDSMRIAAIGLNHIMHHLLGKTTQ